MLSGARRLLGRTKSDTPEEVDALEDSDGDFFAECEEVGDGKCREAWPPRPYLSCGRTTVPTPTAAACPTAGTAAPRCT